MAVKDSGNYVCKATNSMGSAATRMLVVVQKKRKYFNSSDVYTKQWQ